MQLTGHLSRHNRPGRGIAVKDRAAKPSQREFFQRLFIRAGLFLLDISLAILFLRTRTGTPALRPVTTVSLSPAFKMAFL